MRVLARVLATLVLTLTAVAMPPAGAADPDPTGVWPLQPEPQVVAGFDPPDVPWGAGHRGVDLLGSPGQAVHAALAGQVTYAGLLAGRGVVVVDHGDTRTTYQPVTAVVAVGDELPQGSVVGRLEASGSHCPPRACLHWGWLRGEVYLDPLGLVGARAVRLLPLWRDQPVGAVPLVPSSPSSWPGPLGLQGLPLPYAAPLLALAQLRTAMAPTRPDPVDDAPVEPRGRTPPDYARGCAC